MSSKWLQQGVDYLNLNDQTKAYINFFTKQFINATSPSNFAVSNPKVISETMNSEGENLVRGIKNFIKDLQSSDKIFSISTSDNQAFRVGENLATTRGKVIYQNELMQ